MKSKSVLRDLLSLTIEHPPQEKRTPGLLIRMISNETPFIVVFMIYTFLSWLAFAYAFQLFSYPLLAWAAVLFIGQFIRFGVPYLKYNRFGILFAVGYLLTLFVNRSDGLGLEHIKTLGWIFLFFILTYSFAYRKDKLKTNFNALSITFQILTLLAGIASLVTYYLNWYYWLILPDGTLRIVGFVNGKRLFGVYRDPNFASILAILAIVFGFIAVFNRWQNRKFSLVLLVANVIVQVMFISLSYSRTGIIGLALAGIMIGIAYLVRARRRVRSGELSRRKWSVGLVAVFSTLLIGLFLVLNPVWNSSNFYRLTHGGETLPTEELKPELTWMEGVNFDQFVQSPTGSKGAEPGKMSPPSLEIPKVVRYRPTESTTLAPEDIIETTKKVKKKADAGAPVRDDMDASSQERLVLMGEAIQIWSHAPIFGTGDRNLHIFAERVEPDTLTAKAGKVPHNAYLYLLVCAGGLGTLIMFVWHAILFIRLLKAFKRRGGFDEVLWSLLIPIVILFFSGLLLQDLYLANSPGSFIFWFCLGMIHVLTETALRSDPESKTSASSSADKREKAKPRIRPLKGLRSLAAFLLILSVAVAGQPAVTFAAEATAETTSEEKTAESAGAEEEKPKLGRNYSTVENPAFPFEQLTHAYNYRNVKFNYLIEIRQVLKGEEALEKAEYFDPDFSPPAGQDLYLYFVKLEIVVDQKDGKDVKRTFSPQDFQRIDESGQGLSGEPRLKLNNPFGSMNSGGRIIQGWVDLSVPAGTAPLVQFTPFGDADPGPVFHLNPPAKQPLQMISLDTGGSQMYNLGVPIPLEVRAKGGVNQHFPLRYAFLADGNVLSGYSQQRKLNWTPNAPGTYLLTALVTDCFTTVRQDSTIMVTSDVPMIASDLQLLNHRAHVGEAAWLNVVPVYGTKPLTYQYFEVSKEGVRSPVSDILDTPLFAWVPDVTGQRTLMVEVTDSYGYKLQRTLSVDVAEERELEILSVLSTDPTSIRKGEPVYFEARVRGGTYPYQYVFYVQRENGDQVVLNAHTDQSDNRLVWYPLDQSIKEIGMRVVDAQGRQQTAVLPITINAGKELELTRFDVASTDELGKNIWILTKAEGGHQPYRYQHIVRRSDGSEAAIDNPRKNGSVLWTPLETGEYEVGVRITDHLGEVIERFTTVRITDPEQQPEKK
jgi:hypothetical protein